MLQPDNSLAIPAFIKLDVSIDTCTHETVSLLESKTAQLPMQAVAVCVVIYGGVQ